MRNLIYILLIIFFLVPKALCYELSRQTKIDAVNSYQPSQFADANLSDDKTRKKFENITSSSSDLQGAFLDYSPIQEDYISESPVAKEKESDIVTAADFSDTSPLEGIVLESKPRLTGRQRWDKAWTWAKGEPAPDALLGGMWSKHTSKNASEKNGENNLLGLQYGGITAAYFKNSWYKDTYAIAFARRCWSKKFNHDLSIDFQYKAGIMHGYESHAPLRIGYVEALLVPLFGFNYKTSGIDIWVIPNPTAPVFAFNFRLGMPEPMTYKSVHAKYQQKHPPRPKPVAPPSQDQYLEIKDPNTVPSEENQV